MQRGVCGLCGTWYIPQQQHLFLASAKICRLNLKSPVFLSYLTFDHSTRLWVWQRTDLIHHMYNWLMFSELWVTFRVG